MRKLLPGIISAILVALPVSQSFGTLPRATKPKPIVHYDTVIASVSADSITIHENKVAKTFKIFQFTEVTLRGQRATVADLKPGMAVSVTVGTDPSTAGRIAAGDAPAHNDPPARPGRSR